MINVFTRGEVRSMESSLPLNLNVFITWTAIKSKSFLGDIENRKISEIIERSREAPLSSRHRNRKKTVRVKVVTARMKTLGQVKKEEVPVGGEIKTKSLTVRPSVPVAANYGVQSEGP